MITVENLFRQLWLFISILFIFVPHLYHVWYKVEDDVTYLAHVYIDLHGSRRFRNESAKRRNNDTQVLGINPYYEKRKASDKLLSLLDAFKIEYTIYYIVYSLNYSGWLERLALS